MRTWLLAVDGSPNGDRAADYAARWARRLRVDEVVVCNVQPLGSYRAYALNREQMLADADERAAQAAAHARMRLRFAGIPHRLVTGLDDPAESIVAAARSAHAGEIVLGSRGLSTLGHLALGSVAYKVVHLADVPVTVAGGPHREPAPPDDDGDGAHRILLALDGSAHSERAARYVVALADAGVPIEATLLNVQPPLLAGEVSRLVSAETLEALHREAGEAALAPARRLLAGHDVRVEARVASGDAGETIAQVADDAACTRIVMGARGLGKLATLVLGSVAYKVVQLATRPVTLVR